MAHRGDAGRGRALRHRRIRGGRAVRQAPDGADDQPEEVLEGFAGSVVATGAGSAAILWALLDVAPWKGVLFGMVVSVAAVLGDLAESLLKRDLGIKDMSNILPGHGGIMDRLDSIVFAVPTAYLLLSVLAPPA